MRSDALALHPFFTTHRCRCSLLIDVLSSDSYLADCDGVEALCNFSWMPSNSCTPSADEQRQHRSLPASLRTPHAPAIFLSVLSISAGGCGRVKGCEWPGVLLAADPARSRAHQLTSAPP